MNLISAITDDSSVEASRKSLTATSLAFAVIASLEFLSNEISIFGLRLGVSQENLISLGRIAVFFLLARFLLQLGAILIANLKGWFKKRDQEWEEQTRANFPDDGPYPDDHYNLDPWEEDFIFNRDKRIKRLKSIDKTEKNYIVTSEILMKFITPILVAFLYLFNPSYLHYLIKAIQ